MVPSAEPTASRPVRVLIEHPGSLVRLELTEELRAAGYEVTHCPGPDAPYPRACPLLADERCPLIESADVIVNGLHAEQEAVLDRQRRAAPDTPVLLLVGPDLSSRPANASGGLLPVGDLLSGAEVVAMVDELVRTRTLG